MMSYYIIIYRAYFYCIPRVRKRDRDFRESLIAVSGLVMPPKLKRQKQSAGAAIKGRERQQEARSSEQVRPVPDTSVSNAPPTAPQTASQSAPPTAPQTALEAPTPPTCVPGPSYNTEQDPDLTPLGNMLMVGLQLLNGTIRSLLPCYFAIP